MVKNVIQIKGGIIINADVSVKIQKIIIYSKTFLEYILVLVHVFVKMINIYKELLVIQ